MSTLLLYALAHMTFDSCLRSLYLADTIFPPFYIITEMTSHTCAKLRTSQRYVLVPFPRLPRLIHNLSWTLSSQRWSLSAGIDGDTMSPLCNF
ncbi:hypothetical protein BC835DRAFT_843479 [Cytidiella melzeri]|nr:hypothetical protein BC835DRAFT_843479 [Cytidiella melzeri]